MTAPTIKGYQIEAEIGSGSAGTVFQARGDDGLNVAIKVFDTMASNPTLIKARVQRVIEHGAQSATVPIFAEALSIRPACLVMPLMVEVLENEGTYFVPKTLQTHLADYMLSDRTWVFLKKLASRLAALHTARVAHGNLKPGNIFLDEEGGPLLSDYASGLMPGVHRLEFSDALLYAPPEQLRYPDGYLEEAGYRWDVFSFGVLAFRLLTGKFPRCQNVFESVCPVAGGQQSVGIEAEHEGIAARLEEDERLEWPTEVTDPRELRYRELIDFCLMLDPQGRPGDMREVARRLERIDEDRTAVEGKEALVVLRNKAERRREIAVGITKVLAVIALGLAGMWAWTQYERYGEAIVAEKKYTDYRDGAVETITSLESDVKIARQAEMDSKNLSQTLKDALLNEQRNALAELHLAHVSNERLHDWILEKGVVGMPTLEGREGRLSLLAEEMITQLEGSEKRPGLEKQTALLRLRIAEVLLAAGLQERGEAALRDATNLGKGHLTAKQKVRASLRLLLLASEQKEKLDPEEFSRTEALIVGSWTEEEDESLRYMATLNLAKARQAEGASAYKDALKLYGKSLAGFEKLAERYPETPALRMNLGRAYQDAALVSELDNDPDNTVKLRGNAAAAFLKLASNPKTVTPELKFQIAAAEAAQSVVAWQNGRSFTAEKMAKEGVAKLFALQSKMPNDFRVATALASQQGIMATVMRDEGRSSAAASLLARSINALESGLKKESTNWNARYLLASLKWQLSGIRGQQGEAVEELRLGTEARDQLRLILDAKARTPHPVRVKVSLAYLCGDLGHAADLGGKKSAGVSFLKESCEMWGEVLENEPKSAEAREGLSWVKQRLREMGVK